MADPPPTGVSKAIWRAKERARGCPGPAEPGGPPPWAPRQVLISRLFFAGPRWPAPCPSHGVLDPILLSGLTLLAGQLACVEPAPVAFTVVLAWRLASSRIRWPVVAFALCAGAAGLARASIAVHEDGARRAAVRAAFGPPARCAGHVSVVSSPVRIGDRYSLLARAGSLTCEADARIAPGDILRLYAERDDLGRGDEVELVASLGVVEVFRNPESKAVVVAAARSGAVLSGGVLDARVVYTPRWAPAAWIDRQRARVRRRIEATYTADAAPLARALVLGESDLPSDDAEAFRASGLSHLLAVSGTHIVVAVLGVVRMAERLLLRIERVAGAVDAGRWAAVAGIPLSWVYAEFAGGGGSVRRAAWMTTAALAARALARRPDGVRAFGLSLLAGGVADPLAAFDLSFGLSAGATAGLLLLSRPLQGILAGLPRPWQRLSGPVAATLSATAFCAPWLAGLGPSISLVGLLANVLAVPIGEAISLPVCLAHLLLAPVPPLERGVALLGSGSLLAVRAIARAGAQASFLSLPVPRPSAWQLAVLAAGLAAIVLRRPRDRAVAALLCCASLVVLEIANARAGCPKGLLRITVLDVGQGDSILIDFPDGRAMLVDGGGIPSSPVDPGVRVVGPELRGRRRGSVDTAVLTHPHPDHVTGLASALPSIRVGELWDTAAGSGTGAPAAYSALRRAMARAGVPVLEPDRLCGHPVDVGGAVARVIAPCPNIDLSQSGNNNSIVMRLEYGATSAMLMGDAEVGEEARILAGSSTPLRADLLKVGHHGSRTSSSSAWLDAVRPRVAFVTSGVRNRYGHPAPETMRAMAERGIRVFRSDVDGAVTWESDGRTVVVRDWTGRER